MLPIRISVLLVFASCMAIVARDAGLEKQSEIQQRRVDRFSCSGGSYAGKKLLDKSRQGSRSSWGKMR